MMPLMQLKSKTEHYHGMAFMEFLGEGAVTLFPVGNV